MWFWSVSWSTNCPVYFSLFLVDQKKFVQSQGIFGQSLIFFWSGSDFFLFSLVIRGWTKKMRDWLKKIRDWPKFFCPVSETGQFFFGRPKRMRNRLDNWSTKRLTKSTWTPLRSIELSISYVSLTCVEMSYVHPSMWFWSVSWLTNCPVFFSF